MTVYSIYRATNLITGKSYIGRTKSPLSKRKSWHYSASRHYTHKFATALKQYNRCDWEWVIITTTDSKEESYSLEEKYITEYDSTKNGYNEKEGDRIPWNKGKKMVDGYGDHLKGDKNPMAQGRTPEHVRKMRSERMKKVQLGKNNHSAKRVYCVELDRYWDTVKECASELGIHKDSISHNCRGKNKTAGGFHFKYV